MTGLEKGGQPLRAHCRHLTSVFERLLCSESRRSSSVSSGLHSDQQGTVENPLKHVRNGSALIVMAV